MLCEKAPVMILLFLLLVVPASFLNAQTQSVTFTSSGNWTVPEGVTQITVEVWGGGGVGGKGGRAGNSSNRSGGGGGGGGAYKIQSSIPVISGTTYTITVGTGGTNTNRNGGVSSAIFGEITVTALGGTGGTDGSGNKDGEGGAGGTEGFFNGGAGANGNNSGGGGGGSAGTNSDGNNADGITGGSAVLGGGAGGDGNDVADGNGTSGSVPGGGGGGGYGDNGNGGNGAPGQVIISWCEPPSITSQLNDQNITYGESAVFSISSGTTGISYQWEVSEDNGNTWNPLAGEESSTLSFTLPTVSMSGNQYRCIVTANCGSFSTSDTTTLLVNKKVINVIAGNQTVTFETPSTIVTQNGTYTLSGFVSGENSSVISGLNSISYTTTYTSSTNAETAGITITPVTSGLSAANYSFVAKPGFVTVTKADQYIICGGFPFSKPLSEFVDEPVPLKVTSSSGLPVTITLEPESAATLNYEENESPPYYLTDIGETGVVIINVTQEGNINFNAATPVTRTFDVTKTNQSISFPEIDDMTYSNGLTLDLDAVASSGLTVTYTVVSGPATVTGNTLNITGAGEIWVTASQPGNASYNPASNVIRSFTVNKGTQTITIHVPAEPLTESTQITATSTSGLPVELTLGTGSDATGLVDQGTYYTLTGPGTIGTGDIYIVGNQAGDDNFLPAAQVIQTIDLNKQNQVIDFDVIADQTYAPSLTVALSATATSELTVSFTVLSGPATLSGTTLTITGAGIIEVEASQDGNSTYNPAPPVTRQFQVAKATPVIMQDDISKTFGDVDFTINPTSTSSGSFSFVSGNTEIFTLSGNVATIVGAGSTLLDITQQPTTNYFGATKTVAFTVGKASSTITITGDTEYTYNASPQGPETSVVTGSTGTVSYSYAGTGSTSYAPNATKPTSAGTYEVTATVAEDLNYAGATSSPYAFSINKADAAINVNAYSETYNGTEYISSGSAIGVSSENLSGLDLSATSHINAGNYTDTWTFTDVTGNYNDASGTVDNTISPKNLTITATDQVKCYGDEFIFTGNEFTSSGLISGETVGSVTLSSSGAASSAAAGSYDIVLSDATGGTFDPNNYFVSYVNGRLTVKPQPTLSVAAQAATVCEGTIATINLSGLLPEKIFSLEYTIDGVAQTTKTGLYSNASGNSSFTTPALSLVNNGQILQITNITITSETPNCSHTLSEEVTLSVAPLPTLTGATPEEPFCDGSAATINLSGLLAGTTFTLYYTIDGIDQTPVTGLVADVSGNAAFMTPALSAANNGQVLQIYGIEITSETPSCYQDFTVDVMLEVATNTTISDHPSATAQNICQDDTPNDLSVTAFGINLSYQWYSNTTQFNSGGNLIDGATNASYTPSTSTAGTLYYYCVVTGDCGTKASDVSGAITVYSTTITSGTVGGASELEFCEGGNPTAFSVGAPAGGDGNYTYQWEESDGCSGTWVNATAQDDISNTLSFNPPALYSTICYRIKITDGCGSVGYSDTKTYNVVPDPVSQTIEPVPASGTTLCVDESVSATFSDGSGGTGTVTDVYEFTTDGGSSWNTYTPGTEITATAGMVGADIIQIRTRRTATGSGCNYGEWSYSEWTVAPDNTITLTSATGTDNQTVNIETNITTITYTTTGATGADFSGLPAGISGSWAANEVNISGTPTETGTFNYTVELTGGCGTVTAEGTITVNNTFDVSTESPGQICNAADGQINYTETDVATPITFTVDMTTGNTAWSPNWEITFTLTPGAGAAIDNISTTAGTFTTTGPYTLTNIPSTNGQGSVDITLEVTGNIYSDLTVDFEITAAKELQHNTPDKDNDDRTATQTVLAIPDTGEITTN